MKTYKKACLWYAIFFATASCAHQDQLLYKDEQATEKKEFSYRGPVLASLLLSSLVGLGYFGFCRYQKNKKTSKVITGEHNNPGLNDDVVDSSAAQIVKNTDVPVPSSSKKPNKKYSMSRKNGEGYVYE